MTLPLYHPTAISISRARELEAQGYDIWEVRYPMAASGLLFEELEYAQAMELRFEGTNIYDWTR